MQDATGSSQNPSHKEHLKLASVVKDVHAKLRKKYNERGDFEEVWREHTSDTHLLHQYADAMLHLAVDHWSKNPQTRIDWCRMTCQEFFLDGGLKKSLEKDERRKKHQEQSLDSNDQIQVDAVSSLNEENQDLTAGDSDDEDSISLPWLPMQLVEPAAVVHRGKVEIVVSSEPQENSVNYEGSSTENVDMSDVQPPEPVSSEWENTCEYISNSKCRKLDTCKICSHAQLNEQNLCRFCLKLEKLRCGVTNPDGSDLPERDSSVKQTLGLCSDDHRSLAVSDSIKVNISDWGSIEKDLPSIVGTTGDREHSFLNPNQICTLPGQVTPGLSITPFSGSLSLEDNANLLSDSDDLDNAEVDMTADPDPDSLGEEDISRLDDITNKQVIEKFEKYSVSNYNVITLPFKGRMRLLDVGSCYNPFLEFKEFLTVGIDISPAVSSVYHCDFLHLETIEPLQLAADTINTYLHNLRDPVERLPRQCFHVIVFSLLLEYFPSTYQRWLCCQRAHELLMMNGLLLIITPDSNHEQKNAPMMKSWKRALESMGFRRWRYTKQEHLHCVAFRKVISQSPANPLVSGVTPDMLYIPQDNNSQMDSESSVMRETLPMSAEDEETYRECLMELPHYI